MKKFFIPTEGPEDWKFFLAHPKQWKTSHSAKALAYCWEEANGFPESVRKVFENSGIYLFQNIELLFAFPEYKVFLPGGEPSSQNDIFVLAKGNCQLISITVEGKTKEGFGNTVDKWLNEHNSKGRQIRLKFLLNKLQLSKKKVKPIRYQLLHRTASAIIEAEKLGAKNALMLVHSFSKKNPPEGLNDYRKFLTLFQLEAEQDSLTGPKNIRGIDLYFGWVNEERKY